MYLYLVSSTAQPWQVHDPTLAAIITTMLTILFTNGSLSNVKIAAQKLKLCGKTLEGEEKFANVAGTDIDEDNLWSEHPAPKMDALMTQITSLSANVDLPEELQKDLKLLLDTRTNEKWASAEADNAKAREESAKLLNKPAPRKSAAIRIEPDPNDVKTRAVQVVKPAAPASSVGGGGT